MAKWKGDAAYDKGHVAVTKLLKALVDFASGSLRCLPESPVGNAGALLLSVLLLFWTEHNHF